MKIRKTIVIRIAFFLVFAIVMSLAARLLCMKTMHGSSQCLALYEQPKNTIDVVMLGSSHMHCDVDPSVLWEEQGIASYVYSGAEQPLWITYHYLIEFCKYQNPKVAVIDLYTPAYYRDFFRTDWMGENLYNMRFSLNKIQAILDTCTLEQIDDFFPSFFGYHSRYSELNENDLDVMLHPGEQEDFKGYIPGFATEVQEMPCLGVEETMRMDKKSERFLYKIIDYAREHDIELFFVVNPYPSKVEHEKIFNTIHEIAEEESVRYLNTNYCYPEMQLDLAKDFRDDSHLNYYGGRKYSSFLGRDLRIFFDLPDRRGDSRYASWDRNAENIRKAAIEAGAEAQDISSGNNEPESTGDETEKADEKMAAAETSEPVKESEAIEPEAIEPEALTEASDNEEATEESEQPDFGRILFIGDSRTIDMFADSDDDIFGEMHDDIAVFGGHGKGLDFMKKSVKEYGEDNFDTLVSWMGANEGGRFKGYGEFYEDMLSKGKQVVVCTVGPTDNSVLHYDTDGYYYVNENMQEYNAAMTAWAEEHDIRVMDLYSFIMDSETVAPDPEDGIHYLPRPTTELWEYIVSELK